MYTINIWTLLFLKTFFIQVLVKHMTFGPFTERGLVNKNSKFHFVCKFHPNVVTISNDILQRYCTNPAESTRFDLL